MTEGGRRQTCGATCFASIAFGYPNALWGEPQSPVLETQVAVSGLNREEYLRTLILGAEVRAKPCIHHADLLRKVAGLCNNANQLAHVANATGTASQESVNEMLRISRKVWEEVREMW